MEELTGGSVKILIHHGDERAELWSRNFIEVDEVIPKVPQIENEMVNNHPQNRRTAKKVNFPHTLLFPCRNRSFRLCFDRDSAIHNFCILSYSFLYRKGTIHPPHLMGILYNSPGMVYLDYAANFPVSSEVLKTLCETELFHFGNAVSKHPAGESSLEEYKRLNQKALRLFGVDPSEFEIVYTSSASESNNLAIKGIYESYQGLGKQILTSEFEHSSVNAALGYLKEKGADIQMVSTTCEGKIDLDDLRAKLTKETILLCLCLVESETGAIEPYQEVEEILKDFPNCHLLIDATQAIGKIPLDLRGIDLLTCTPHKFGGLIGTGFLLKRKTTVLTPLIHGGMSVSPYRSGTTPLGLIASSVKALELAMEGLNAHYESVSALRKHLLEGLSAIPSIQINSPSDFPYILNLSLKGKRAKEVTSKLAQKGICVSQKSACSIPNTPSKTIMAIYRDRARALSSFRVSLSYLTTQKEIDALTEVLKEIANE